jgi:hypothetical protein
MLVDWLGVAKNRAPYRERLVWGVAPFAVRTDDMRGTLYALPVCARGPSAKGGASGCDRADCPRHGTNCSAFSFPRWESS